MLHEINTVCLKHKNLWKIEWLLYRIENSWIKDTKKSSGFFLSNQVIRDIDRCNDIMHVCLISEEINSQCHSPLLQVFML